MKIEDSKGRKVEIEMVVHVQRNSRDYVLCLYPALHVLHDTVPFRGNISS